MIKRALNHHRLEQEAQQVAACLPELLLAAERLSHTIQTGLHGRRRTGQGETFWQYRSFMSGDPASQIDWRQSARSSDRHYIRESEWETATTVWIWVDNSPRMTFQHAPANHTKLWRAQIVATALCILLVSAGEHVGLVGTKRPFTGRSASQKFAQEMLASQRGQNTHANTPSPPLAQAPHTRHVYLSDFFMDVDAFDAWSKRTAALGIKGHLLQVTDPAEASLPFKGRVHIHDMAHNAPAQLFGRIESVQHRYQKAFEAHQQYLQNLCTRYNWTFLAHDTSHPPITALSSLYTALAHQT